MRKLSKLIFMLVISAAAGASAIAADSSDKAAGDVRRADAHQMTPEKMQERIAKRHSALHDQLKLTAAQEPAWKTYVAAVTPTDMGKHWVDHAAMAKMSAPERLEKHIAMSKERDTRMAAHLAALKTFYVVLTPQQQKIFNEKTMHGRKHRGHYGDGDKAKA